MSPGMLMTHVLAEDLDLAAHGATCPPSVGAGRRRRPVRGLAPVEAEDDAG